MLSTLAIKCLGNLKVFQFASVLSRQKNLPKTQQKSLYNTSAMASAYLDIAFAEGYGLAF